MREFLKITRGPGVKLVRIKKIKNGKKFKVRTSKYLYTLTVNDLEKADRLQRSLNPSTKLEEIK